MEKNATFCGKCGKKVEQIGKKPVNGAWNGIIKKIRCLDTPAKIGLFAFLFMFGLAIVGCFVTADSTPDKDQFYDDVDETGQEEDSDENEYIDDEEEQESSYTDNYASNSEEEEDSYQEEEDSDEDSYEEEEEFTFNLDDAASDMASLCAAIGDIRTSGLGYKNSFQEFVEEDSTIENYFISDYMYEDIWVQPLFVAVNGSYSINVKTTNFGPAADFEAYTYKYTPYDSEAEVNVEFTITYSGHPEHEESWEEEKVVKVEYTTDSYDGRLRISSIKTY